jgi:uncharacterized protein (DUF2141 family)
MAGRGALRRAAGALLTISMLTFAPALAAGELRVAIDGVRSAEGNIMLGLYDSDEGFATALELYDEPDGFIKDRDRVAGAALSARSGVRQASFRDLEPGRYAIIVFHDENADGRLDKNFLGIPLEGYGFSNEARGLLGPPGFGDAAFSVGEGATVVRIEMRY